MSIYNDTGDRLDGVRPLQFSLMKYHSPLLVNVRSPKVASQFGELPHRKGDNVEATGMSDPAALPASTFNPQTDSLHASMRPIIMLAQCFSMFPVSGVNTPDASYLRFTWRSPKFLYCAISVVSSSVMTIFNVVRITSTGISSIKMSNAGMVVGRGKERVQPAGRLDEATGRSRLRYGSPLIRHRSLLHLHTTAFLFQPYAKPRRESLLRFLLWIPAGQDNGGLSVRRSDTRRVSASRPYSLQRFRHQLLHRSDAISLASDNGQHLPDRHEILLGNQKSRVNRCRHHSHLRVGSRPVQLGPADWRVEQHYRVRGEVAAYRSLIRKDQRRVLRLFSPKCAPLVFQTARSTRVEATGA